ncbi:HAD-IIIA family hydrolase [Pilimelia columellifera]|uniref:D,D-heptose 1,7-bisphosphate phosphatase n=1 Tax=Pilimelia columellifera subsp. columellifera TaxID=706583 RepID=A0ABP6ALR1_9ACTN
MTSGRRFDAVLFDRDGTLIVDVPYNGDPARVTPVPGARLALDRLREAGLRLGVVTNQSGLARGRFTREQLRAVNERVQQLLGPFDTWQICPHDDNDRCACRKPAPELVRAAARALGTTADRCVVVGDIGRDMAAALAAGAAGILVPTDVTLKAEVAAAPTVAGDLAHAVDLILRRQRLLTVASARPGRGGHVLAIRADSLGDMVVTGPAIRALAAGADRLTLWCGPRGRAAAELLPGVDAIREWHTPWIDAEPRPVEADQMRTLVDQLNAEQIDEAVIFTSFHQSCLPTALLLRLAEVRRISAISDDYPGSLLDVRHRPPLGLPEAERALSLAAAAGFALPAGDDGRLALDTVRVRAAAVEIPAQLRGRSFVVVHPGASVPARACSPARCAPMVAALARAGHTVVVTGGPDERALTASVADRHAMDLGGRLSLAGLAALLAAADIVVVGNTGPAHLAAAVGAPVVSLFAATVPFGQWSPYRVPTARLGDAMASCRNSRALNCPTPAHHCLDQIEPTAVMEAVATLGRNSNGEAAR